MVTFIIGFIQRLASAAIWVGFHTARIKKPANMVLVGSAQKNGGLAQNNHFYSTLPGRIRTTPQEDNSPPYRFWSWCSGFNSVGQVVLVGSCRSGGTVLGIVQSSWGYNLETSPDPIAMVIKSRAIHPQAQRNKLALHGYSFVFCLQGLWINCLTLITMAIGSGSVIEIIPPGGQWLGFLFIWWGVVLEPYQGYG